MKISERVLLAKRKDGKFLRLDEQRNTTTYDFTEKPELAKRVYARNSEDLDNPKQAAYYFENSHRAREFWIKDCIMVCYKITTEVIAIAE